MLLLYLSIQQDMDKLIFVVVFAVIILGCCDSNTKKPQRIERQKTPHLGSILVDLNYQSRKIEEECPGIIDKTRESIRGCDHQWNDSLTLCAQFQAYGLQCSSPIAEAADKCLPEKARGLPNLLIKSVLSLADHLCKQRGESIFEIFNPCLLEDEGKSLEELAQCEQKVRSLFKNFENRPSLPSVPELCSSLTNLRTCVQELGVSCKDQKTKNAIVGLYSAVLAPCNHL